MRLDQYLKRVLIFKSRNQASIAMRKGLVFLNGRPTKPSCEVRVGDIITVDYPDMLLKIKVLDIPAGNVSKRDKEKYFSIVEKRRKEVLEENSDFIRWLMGDEFE